MTENIKKAAAQLVSDAEQARRSRGGHTVVLEKFVEWTEHMELFGPNAYYIIFPGLSGNWMLHCIPPSSGSFTQRVPLPKGWAGLPYPELREVSGIPEVVFCYADRSIAGAKTKAAALALAEQALEQQFKDERVEAVRWLRALFAD